MSYMIGPLSADAPPPLDWSRLGTTHLGWVPSILLLAAAGLYLWGAGRVRRAEGAPWSFRRTAAFLAGLVITFVAVEAVIGAYDDQVFYDHMTQHLMLVMLAGPLFAMGAPLDLLQRASSGRARLVIDAGLGSRLAELVGHPITSFILYAVLIPLTHLTSFYNYTLSNDLVHDTEHIAFLVVGYLFWRPVVGIEPSRHPLSPALQLLYLALAVPVDTFSGLALTATNHELFSFYNTFTRTWGPSRLTDLHIGGSIMWVGGDTLMFIAMIPVAVRWVRSEEERTRELDAELDRLEAERGNP
jgi:cytochrome c oxidase assembly factor CtaG